MKSGGISCLLVICLAAAAARFARAEDGGAEPEHIQWMERSLEELRLGRDSLVRRLQDVKGQSPEIIHWNNIPLHIKNLNRAIKDLTEQKKNPDNAAMQESLAERIAELNLRLQFLQALNQAYAKVDAATTLLVDKLNALAAMVVECGAAMEQVQPEEDVTRRNTRLHKASLAYQRAVELYEEAHMLQSEKIGVFEESIDMRDGEQPAQGEEWLAIAEEQVRASNLRKTDISIIKSMTAGLEAAVRATEAISKTEDSIPVLLDRIQTLRTTADEIHEGADIRLDNAKRAYVSAGDAFSNAAKFADDDESAAALRFQAEGAYGKAAGIARLLRQ